MFYSLTIIINFISHFRGQIFNLFGNHNFLFFVKPVGCQVGNFIDVADFFVLFFFHTQKKLNSSFTLLSRICSKIIRLHESLICVFNIKEKWRQVKNEVRKKIKVFLDSSRVKYTFHFSISLLFLIQSSFYISRWWTKTFS